MTMVVGIALLPLQVGATWTADWAWGCLLIVLTLITHVVGLGFMSHWAIVIQDKVAKQRHSFALFSVLMGATAFVATVLHGVEAGIWGLAYLFLGAVPNYRSAMLYSLGAMTTYGHETRVLEDRWRLMGSVEALNGWLLFGLSTAFLFWLFQKVLPSSGSNR